MRRGSVLSSARPSSPGAAAHGGPTSPTSPAADDGVSPVRRRRLGGSPLVHGRRQRSPAASPPASPRASGAHRSSMGAKLVAGAVPPLSMFAYSSMLLEEAAPPAATALSPMTPAGPRMSPAERLQLVSQLPVQFEGELGFKPRASRMQSSRKRWAQLRGRTALLVFRDAAAAAAATGRGKTIDGVQLVAVYDLGAATVECMQKKNNWRIWLRPRSDPGESLLELPFLSTESERSSCDGESAGGSLASLSYASRGCGGGGGPGGSSRDVWDSPTSSSIWDSAPSTPRMSSSTLLPPRTGPVRSDGASPSGVPPPRGTPTHVVNSPAPSGMDAVFKLRSASDFTAWSTVLTVASSLDTPCLADFEVGAPIGVGGGGRVYAVRHVGSTTVHAMKVVNKRGVLFSPSTLRNAVSERLALERLASGHPFLLPLRYAFQTADHLFLVTELCDAGDLATHLRKQPGGRCTEDDVRFLAAELILALEHIHSHDVVFRDMKPENVLLCREGHVRVADFGLASFLPSADGCANSLCGTPSFLPPEMLNGKPYGISADMWSLGVCLFRCVTGKLPWGRVGHASATFRSIKSDTVEFPSFLEPTTVSFLAGLLERKVSRRLTVKAAKAHPYFASVDWADILVCNGPGLDVEPTDVAARFRLFETAEDGPLPDFLGGTACPDELGGAQSPPVEDDPMVFEADVESEAAAWNEDAPVAAVARKLLLSDTMGGGDSLAAAATAALGRCRSADRPTLSAAATARPAVRTDWAGPRVALAPTESSLATTLVGYEYSNRPAASAAGLSVALVHRKSSADMLLSKIASIRSGS